MVGSGENTLKSNEKRYKYYNKTRIIYNHYKGISLQHRIIRILVLLFYK